MVHYGSSSIFKPGYIAVVLLPFVVLLVIFLPSAWRYLVLFTLAVNLFSIYRMWADGFYFKTTKHKFIIKNYALPFWSTSCKLTAIVSVRIVKINNGYGLRVVNSGRRSMLYFNPGFTLNDWERLTHDLLIKGVAVEWVIH